MRKSALCITLAAVLAACGGSPARGPRSRLPGRPELDAVSVADSTPATRGALTLAVATPGDARAALLLAELVARRLGERAEQGGLFPRDAVQSGFGAEGYRVTAPLPPGQERRVVELLRASYMDPVSPAEAAALAPKERAYAAWPESDDAQRAEARCRGVFHRAAGAASLRSAEALRKEAQTDAITLGVAASAASIERVRQALESGPAWGPMPAASSPTASDSSWQVRAVASKQTRVHVLAWEGAKSARAQLALGRMLDDPGALAVPLAALGGGVQLESADATLVPLRGTCLAVTVTWPERADDAAITQAVALIQQRLQALAPSAQGLARGPRFVAEGATAPAAIAERAALLALAERGAQRASTQHLVEWPQTHGEPAAPSAASLAARLSREEPRDGGLGFAEAVRSGLPESWLLLASPCGTQGESEQDAGASAAYALAAAARASELTGAHVMPWVEPDRIGLLLHAGARPGESAGARAERLASGAARAWLGDELALEAALRQLEQADAEGQLGAFAPPAPFALPAQIGLAFPEGDAHAALAFGEAAVPVLRPFGTVRSRRALRMTSVRLRGETLAHAPLAAGYLASERDEAARARSVLTSTLRSTGPCPAPRATPEAASSGRLVRVPESPGAPLLVLLRVPDAVDAANAAAAAAYFDDTLGERLEGRLRRHRVEQWGGAQRGPRALALRLDVPAAAREATLTEIRRWFADLGAGKGVDPARWRAARSRVDALRGAAQDDFRMQTLALWSRAAARPQLPSTTPASQPPFAALCAEANLIVVTPDS